MINKIAECVTDHFVDTGSGMIVKEIAQAMGVSDSTVRRAMAKADNFVPGVTAYWGTRPRYSTNYKGSVVGTSRVEIFEPTSEHLRNMIKTYRAQEA